MDNISYFRPTEQNNKNVLFFISISLTFINILVLLLLKVQKTSKKKYNEAYFMTKTIFKVQFSVISRKSPCKTEDSLK